MGGGGGVKAAFIYIYIYLFIYLTVILPGYELIYITNEAVGELVIISSYPASPRRITVLANFQAVQ